MWHRGKGEMPLKVFNSTTVYLSKKMRKGVGGERDAILVLILLCGGILTVVIML